MATKVFCDRCDKELDDKNIRKATVTLETAQGFNPTIRDLVKNLDLCLRHTEELRRWITEKEITDRAA